MLRDIEEEDKILVFGYIRKNAKMRIPAPIINLCIVFCMDIAIDSNILTNKEKKMLKNILRAQKLNINDEVDGKYKNLKFNLLYTLSKEGKSGKIFHEKCNNKGATVIVVQSQHNHVFGGYTSVSWQSTSNYATDQYAFLFLLRTQFEQRKSTIPKICKLNKGYARSAVYHYRNHGPAWYVNV